MLQPLVNARGEVSVMADGYCIAGEDGDGCCCDGGGGGGEPRWIYLRRYCTANDCSGWVKVWSETDWGDGTTWGQSFHARAYCPAIFKLGGACFVVYCPGTNITINCPDDQIQVYDGPGIGGVWFHWRDRAAACGLCCQEIRCVPRLRWVCGVGGGHWSCSDLGRQYKVTRRETFDRTVNSTPAFVAYLNTGRPPPAPCTAELEQHQRCSNVNVTAAVLKVGGDGCLELTGRCDQDLSEFYQTFLLRDPDCRYETTQFAIDNCHGQEVGVPDPSISAFNGSLGEACGFAIRTDGLEGQWLFDGNGCPIKRGSHVGSLGGNSWFIVKWTFYEDDGVSHFTFEYETHEYCQTLPNVEIECSREKITGERLYTFIATEACQSEDGSECNGGRAAGPVRMNGVLSIDRQSVDRSFGQRVRVVGADEVGGVGLEALL